jgi:ABC-2 type transport system permease protein
MAAQPGVPEVRAPGLAAARGIMLSSMRTRRTGTFWFAVAGGLIALLIGILYEVILAAIDLTSYLNEFPPEMLAAFGMSSSVLGSSEISYAGFMSFEFFPWFGVALAVYALVASGSQIAGEVERGTIDVVLSSPVPRWVFALSKYLGLLVPLLIIGFSCVLFSIAAGLIQGVELPVARFLYTGVVMGMLGGAFASIGVFFSVLWLSSQRAQIVLAVIVIAQYVMDVVSKISDDWEFLGRYSLFNYYDTGLILEGFEWTWAPLIIYSAVAVIGLVATVVFFERRDLAA